MPNVLPVLLRYKNSRDRARRSARQAPEEKGLLGAKALDVTQLRARDGLVLDCDDPHVLYTQGPAQNSMTYRISGVESHAGVAPERGLSAIRVAAEAITAMKLGRIDEETTANLGVIQGGVATNIIPNFVEVRGEARSRNLEKLEVQTAHMTGCFEQAAVRHRREVDGQVLEARVEVQVERAYDLLNVPDDAPIVRLVLQAAAALGTAIETQATGGGCDANVYNGRGLHIANLGTGMSNIHTVREFSENHTSMTRWFQKTGSLCSTSRPRSGRRHAVRCSRPAAGKIPCQRPRILG